MILSTNGIHKKFRLCKFQTTSTHQPVNSEIIYDLCNNEIQHKVWKLHIDAMVTYPALIMHHVMLKFLVKVVMVTCAMMT